MRRSTRFHQALAWMLAIAAWPGWCLALERFPPPEFTSGYTFPVVQHPSMRSVLQEYGDVGVLLLGLGLASWLALRRRSRIGLQLLSIGALGYFGFWRKGCICPIGSIQNTAQALWDPQYALPLSVLALFLIPLVFALFYGRTFCAAVCPHGALQEILLIRPVQMPAWLNRALGLIPYLVLGFGILFAATGCGYLVCAYDPFVAFFRFSGARTMLCVGAGFLILALFIGRPFCRFACPYGALLNMCSRFTWRHVTITPDECIRCRLCEKACPYGAIRVPVPAEVLNDRKTGKGVLTALLVLSPAIVLAGIGVGYRSGPALATLHRTVQLAREISREDAASDTAVYSERSAIYRATGDATEDLYSQARIVVHRMQVGAAILGGCLALGLVLALVGLTIRKDQQDYVPDRASCFACARCFQYCPRELVRQGLLPEDPQTMKRTG